MLKPRIGALAALPLIAVAPNAEAAATQASVISPPLDYRFEVAMVRGSFWNPATLRNDPVELRSYRGAGMKDGDFTAPTLRVVPGQTLRIHLDNRLPACTGEDSRSETCPNDTNLHTHGLWVSPSGNSDNVMISIPPGRSFDYEFHIPAEHPAGTFWYHPHRHGSGMYQLGSGMAGVLIVEGNRLPTAARPGDVDILLKDDRGRSFPERILLFQNIPYSCAFEKDGYGRALRNNDGKRLPQPLCEPGEVGRVESFKQFVIPPDGTSAGRFYPVNGKMQPVLRGAVAGRFERWRILASGFHGVMRLGLRRLAPGAPDLATVPGAQHPQWIDRYCTGPLLPAWQVAHDGLTRPEIRRAVDSTVIPGGRLDLLTWFPGPGRYCLLQLRPPAANPATRPVLALVDVGGRTVRAAGPDTELRRLLVKAARRALRGGLHRTVRERVIADLENGLRLGAFVPHPTIKDSELTGHQTAELRTVGPERNGEFLIDGRKFDHGRIDRHLPLGGIEEWRISVPANGESHVFHIHVNPFQIVSIRNAKGEDMADPASPGFNAFYEGLTGQWLDTVLLEPSTTVVMRTRYERFIGDIMLHCHLVAHSDLGMMQHIRIHLPGEPVPAHAQH